MKNKLLEIRDFQDSTFILRMERNGLEFEPGQYIMVCKPGGMEKREYTVYSSPNQDFIGLLIKDVDGGDVSGLLHRCPIGIDLEIEGPFGNFTLPAQRRNKKLLFVSTGTGIAPFHSYVSSYRNLDYQILHGVQYPDQLYGKETFNPERHVDCLSRDECGRFHGRVTDYLRQHPIVDETFCYLCGSSGMIYEVFEILQDQGVPRDHIITETYF